MTSDVLAGPIGDDGASFDPARFAHIQMYARGIGQSVQWRLLSGNNRELGRGVHRSPDLARCLAAVTELRERFADVRSVIRRSDRGVWSWELELDGLPVASPGHDFPRLIRCQQSLARFAENFVTAPVGTTAIDTTARRWDLRLPPRDPRQPSSRSR